LVYPFNSLIFFTCSKSISNLFSTKTPLNESIKFLSFTTLCSFDKFSFKTIANQKEWQTKSAGSFIPNFSFYYTNFDLNDGSGGEHSDVYLATLSASYFYNLVIKEKFLVSAGLSPGFGFNDVDGDVSPLYEVTGSFKIGYNVDSFFSFINLNFTDFVQDTDAKIRLNDNFSTFKFTLGYRFNPPKKIKEVYDKANKKIQF
jgi:hypothetical protein